jgi:hypothetical protein
MLAVPLLQASDQCGVVRLHAMLRHGDVLLGDRAFGTYVHLALLNLRGVFACCRLHQCRKITKARGIERWHRPADAPAWMNEEQFLQLPLWIEVRLVSYVIRQSGFRTRHVTLVSTLLDSRAWSDQRLAELYGQRWEIETCFNHLKTTMKMNVLKCQTVDGVLKELAVYLLVYNLVRLLMSKTATQRLVEIRRVSFIDALRWLSCRMLGLAGVERLIVNPLRPSRQHPRVIRRRSKKYPLMKRPRRELIAQLNQPENTE